MIKIPIQYVDSEMPSACSDCLFIRGKLSCKTGQHSAYCIFLKEKWREWREREPPLTPFETRHPSCPIIEFQELKPKHLFFWRNPDETEERSLGLYQGEFHSCGASTQEEAEDDASEGDSEEGFILFQATAAQFNKAHKRLK